MDKNNIALIGFMGCGKTTIGKIAAEKLGRIFVDTDEEIQKKCGMTVEEIFEIKGEEFFRHMESTVVREVCQLEGAVISCGGGLVKKGENMKVLMENALVIYLKADIESIWSRIKGDVGRPLAAERSKEEIQKLMNERENFYSAAHVSVITSCKNPYEISDEVLEIYNRYLYSKEL